MFSRLLLLGKKILASVVNLPQALLTFVRDWLHFRKLANRFPGPPTLPLVGNLLDIPDLMFGKLFDSKFVWDQFNPFKWLLEDMMEAYPAGQLVLGPLRLFLLSDVNDVQEKALKELEDIFDAAGSTEVSPDTLQRMQYVEMIVKETLRMHPPIFFILKEAGVDTPLLSRDLIVPAGATVTISPKSLHMDPKLYPDPHLFDPERFSPENSAKRHPYAFIPFGAGMRACIGRRYAMLALKTVLSKVIWNYHIHPDESYEPQFIWGISTVTSNGMRIKLTKRSTSKIE